MATWGIATNAGQNWQVVASDMEIRDGVVIFKNKWTDAYGTHETVLEVVSINSLMGVRRLPDMPVQGK